MTEHFNRKTITELKIRDRPTTDKLFQVLESTPPKGPETGEKWFRFLAEKGGKQSHNTSAFCVLAKHAVFSAGGSERIADLKMVPLEVSSKQPQSGKSYEPLSPLECFPKSESYPEDHFYQRLFEFVNFGRSFNAFLEALGVKERLECIEVLKVLLRCPKRLLKLAGDDHERCVSVPG